jgi:DNA end-binding protein Ku
VVKPLNRVLVLETMHFAAELRDPAEVQPPQTSIGEKEMEMALSLVKAMSDRWNPAKYHDEYRECLMKLIEQKVNAGGKKLPAPKETAKPAPGKVIDLVSLLQQSLSQSGKSQKKKPAKHRAPHRKAA